MGSSMIGGLFIALFLAIGFAILAFAARSYFLAQQAADWPTAPGRILSSDFEVDSDSDGTTYRVRVSYEYEAAGLTRQGDRIAFGYAGSSGEKFHRSVYKTLPAETRLAVRYDPNDPDRSVLSFGVNQSIIFMLIFGVIWTVFTLGFCALMFLDSVAPSTLVSNIVVYDRP